MTAKSMVELQAKLEKWREKGTVLKPAGKQRRAAGCTDERGEFSVPRRLGQLLE